MTSRSGRKNYIRRPDVVERIGSYLGTSFPLFHAIAAFAALQYNEAAGREVQCGDGPEFSWMDVPGILHQPHHAPTLAILHRLINCVLRQDTASLGTLAMHLNHLAWPGTSAVCGPHRLQQLRLRLHEAGHTSQAVKATIKKLVVPLYTSR